MRKQKIIRNQMPEWLDFERSYIAAKKRAANRGPGNPPESVGAKWGREE